MTQYGDVIPTEDDTTGEGSKRGEGSISLPVVHHLSFSKKKKFFCHKSQRETRPVSSVPDFAVRSSHFPPSLRSLSFS